MTGTGSLDAPGRNGVAIIVYNSTFDIAMMPMMVAQGALAMGMEVSIFYTFFGLNAIKKGFKPKLPGLWRLFTGMISKKMAAHKVPPYEQMLKDSIAMGAKIYGCSTSMAVMGVGKDKLIDGVEVAGVAKFLDMAANAGTTLTFG
jgi:peroxiredoxin family protein